jgi:hypothetical protein
MRVLSATSADIVHHHLAIGLQYIDAANGLPLSGSMTAVIESIGTRRAGFALRRKASGAALRFDRHVGRLFQGPANGTIQAKILIAPERPIGQALPPDRSISPRRIVVKVSLDAQGLPLATSDMANGNSPLGKWIFPVRLHRGVAARLSPGATAVRGQLVHPDAASPMGLPIRWAHVEARLGAQLIAVARTDDRGEFLLVLRGRPGQLPEKLQPIAAQLTYFVPPAATGSMLPYADLVTETLDYPDLEADRPPSGYVSKAGPLLILEPGKIRIMATQVIPP